MRIFDPHSHMTSRTTDDYQAMYDAYVRIYSRAELNFLPVEADTGVMGGDVSRMVPPSVAAAQATASTVAKSRRCLAASTPAAISTDSPGPGTPTQLAAEAAASPM